MWRRPFWRKFYLTAIFIASDSNFIIYLFRFLFPFTLTIDPRDRTGNRQAFPKGFDCGIPRNRQSWSNRYFYCLLFLFFFFIFFFYFTFINESQSFLLGFFLTFCAFVAFFIIAIFFFCSKLISCVHLSFSHPQVCVFSFALRFNIRWRVCAFFFCLLVCVRVCDSLLAFLAFTHQVR